MLSWLKEGQTHFYFQKPNFLEAAEGGKDGIFSFTELSLPALVVCLPDSCTSNQVSRPNEL